MAENSSGGEAVTYTKEQFDAEVAGLKAKNTELLGSVAQLKDKVKTFDGIDPARYQELLEADKKSKADKQKAEGDWEAREQTLRTEAAEAHESAMKPLREKVQELEGDLFEAIAVRDGLMAMADSEIDAIPELAMPVLRPELIVVTDKGQRVTGIKGADQKARIKADGSLVTAKDRLLELKRVPAYAGMFNGRGASGSGADGGSGGGGGDNKDLEKMPPGQRLAVLRRRGAKA